MAQQTDETQEVSYKLYGETRGTDPEAEERGIKSANDYRAPDVYQELNPGGIRSKVYSRDSAYNEHRGAIEPADEYGWYVMLQDGSGRILMDFASGPIPEPFKSSLLEGRELVGCIISRDFQQHN